MPEPVARRVLAGLTVALASLSACASVTGKNHYPPEWASIETTTLDGACPHLEGRYNNIGAATSPADRASPPPLSEVFARIGFPVGEPSAQSVPQTVEIRQTPERLTLVFQGAGMPDHVLEFRRYHFHWKDTSFLDLFHCPHAKDVPRLMFMAGEQGPRRDDIFYVQENSTGLMLLASQDGSLVVEWRREIVGVSTALLGSNMSFDTTWWRYARETPTHFANP